MSRLFLATTFAVLLAGAAGAADPAFDKALRDSLAAVHNSGADLYNQGKDYPGAYRLYEGALRTSRPLLPSAGCPAPWFTCSPSEAKARSLRGTSSATWHVFHDPSGFWSPSQNPDGS